MPSGHLIPTPVTDKNGKQTTVHKKPVSAAAARVQTPPPAAAPQMRKLSAGELDDYVWKLAEEMNISMQECAESLMYSNLEYINENMPEVFVDLTTRIDQSEGMEKDVWSLCLRTFQCSPLHPDEEHLNWKTRVVRNLHILPLACELWDDPEEYSVMSVAASARDAIKSVLNDIDDDDYDLMKAAVLASWIMRDKYGRNKVPDYRQDWESLNFMADHFDAVMTARHELRKRQTITPDDVEAIISTASPSLMDGAL